MRLSRYLAPFCQSTRTLYSCHVQISHLFFLGQIQSKFEGEAVCSGGAEKFSEIGDESMLYTTISDPTTDRRLSIYVLRKCPQLLCQTSEA